MFREAIYGQDNMVSYEDIRGSVFVGELETIGEVASVSYEWNIQGVALRVTASKHVTGGTSEGLVSVGIFSQVEGTYTVLLDTEESVITSMDIGVVGAEIVSRIGYAFDEEATPLFDAVFDGWYELVEDLERVDIEGMEV